MNIWSIAVLVSLVIGVAHAIYVYRQELRIYGTTRTEYAAPIRSRAAYHAVWTLLLWALAGASVVIYWLVAIVPYFIVRILRRSS